MAVALTAAAGGSSRSRTSSPASRTGYSDPDTSLVVEDIIEGYSIASFKSLVDLEV